MEIRKVTTESEMDQVARFRYEILVKEMGYASSGADHDKETVIDAMDSFGHIYAAWHNGEIVGTIRFNLFREDENDDMNFFLDLVPSEIKPWFLSSTNKLAVAQKFRKTSLMFRLCSLAYRQGLERDLTHDVIYCYSNMVSVYEKVGYKIIRDDVIHPKYGDIYLMILDLHDGEYLKSIRSPFFPVLNSAVKSF